MKCNVHPSVDASGQCNGCKVALCPDCVSCFEVPLCEKCFVSHNRAVAIEMYKGLAITVLIMVAGVWFGISNDFPAANGTGYVFLAVLPAFTFWGWRFLSDKLPVLTHASGAVWILYFFIKLTLAYFIGLIVGPYQIYKLIRQLRAATKANSTVLAART